MIKVTLSDKSAGPTFPRLMSSGSGAQIVLMISVEGGRGSGFRVLGGSVGYHSDGWMMDMFTDYNGPVTLQNE